MSCWNSCIESCIYNFHSHHQSLDEFADDGPLVVRLALGSLVTMAIPLSQSCGLRLYWGEVQCSNKIWQRDLTSVSHKGGPLMVCSWRVWPDTLKKMVTKSPHPSAAHKKIKIFLDMCCNLVEMMSCGVSAAADDRAASTFYLKMKCM